MDYQSEARPVQGELLVHESLMDLRADSQVCPALVPGKPGMSIAGGLYPHIQTGEWRGVVFIHPVPV